MMWDMLNSSIRLAIACLIIWQLTRHFDAFSLLERVGMGLAGSCSLLTITEIWEHERSPFDGWAGTLFSLGVFLYILGCISRNCAAADLKARRR